MDHNKKSVTLSMRGKDFGLQRCANAMEGSDS